MKNTITLIRHGESLANINPDHYQYPDKANILTAKGVNQCLDLMERMPTFMGNDFCGLHTTVIASEYQRAKITADIVMSNINLKLPIKYDNRLNETYHSARHVREEATEDVRERVLSLVKQHPFNLILFCHGMLMANVDPAKGNNVKNCEIRQYDRNDFIAMLENKIVL